MVLGVYTSRRGGFASQGRDVFAEALGECAEAALGGQAVIGSLGERFRPAHGCVMECTQWSGLP